ncbi:hypothetical protein NMG60_11016671 [Bertholletia excelsa]
MAVAFPNISWWLWSGKHQEPKEVSRGSSLNPSVDRESDTSGFSMVWGGNTGSSQRRVKRKWRSREERKIDREHDVVLVPSDGGCVSGSESDGSDWSIGWLEPHGPGFQRGDDLDDSFAVLVPCYGRDQVDMEGNFKNKLLGAMESAPDIYATESKKYLEQWLSSLQSTRDHSVLGG